jgi:hypothetical protein
MTSEYILPLQGTRHHVILLWLLSGFGVVTPLSPSEQ